MSHLIGYHLSQLIAVPVAKPLSKQQLASHCSKLVHPANVTGSEQVGADKAKIVTKEPDFFKCKN